MLLSISGISAGSEETICCGQAKKPVAGWQEAWKTAHSDVLPSAAALWGAVRRATQQMCERFKCTFILRPILPVGKLSFSKIRHCNLGHPSCHGKSRLWQHNGDLALSTVAFFPSNSTTSHSSFPVLISKSQTLQEGCTTEELTHLWQKHWCSSWDLFYKPLCKGNNSRTATHVCLLGRFLNSLGWSWTPRNHPASASHGSCIFRFDFGALQNRKLILYAN